MSANNVINFALPELQKDDYFIFQTIMNKMKKSRLTGNSASVECKISIDSIKILEGKGCLLDFMNSCSADDSSTELFFKAVSESLWMFTPEQKQRLESKLNIKLDTDKWYKTINDKCDVYAKIFNKIEIGHLSVDSCQANLIFHNTGSAKATCAISSFFKGFEEEAKEEASIPLHFVIGLLVIFISFTLLIFLTSPTLKKRQRVNIKLK